MFFNTNAIRMIIFLIVNGLYPSVVCAVGSYNVIYYFQWYLIKWGMEDDEDDDDDEWW